MNNIEFIKNLNLKAQVKNIYFWLGVTGTLFAAGNVDFSTLTNWKLLLDAILNILNNPVSLVSILMCFIAIINDNSTSGLNNKKGE